MKRDIARTNLASVLTLTGSALVRRAWNLSASKIRFLQTQRSLVMIRKQKRAALKQPLLVLEKISSYLLHYNFVL